MLFRSYSFRVQAYRPSRVVVTLDPSKFAEKKQRRFHIGNLQSFKPSIALRNQSSPVVVRGMVYDCRRLPKTYPSDTKAFLYYFKPPEKPRLAGELRLRITSSDDHASFESGSDLLKLDGQPWSRSLYNVSKFWTPLYEKLREDGLVPDDLDAVLSTFPRNFSRARYLYTLNDTFIIDISLINPSFCIITEQGVGRLIFHGLCVEHRQTRTKRPAYTGDYCRVYKSLSLD